jgi:hypothetical protein
LRKKKDKKKDKKNQRKKTRKKKAAVRSAFSVIPQPKNFFNNKKPLTHCSGILSSFPPSLPRPFPPGGLYFA